MQKILVIFLGLALHGCASTPEISRDYDPAVNFWALRTYAWAPSVEHAGKDVVVESDTLLHQRVQAAVDRELALKGYSRQTDESRQPDFRVAYHVAIARRRDVIIYNNYFGYGYGWGRYGYYPMAPWMGPDAFVREYDERTLVLDILDPNNRKLMWRATARDYGDEGASPNEKARIIWDAVHKMLQGFPPTTH